MFITVPGPVYISILPPLSHMVGVKPKWGGLGVKWENIYEKKKYSPKARQHATKEEHAVALDKGGEEGEEAIDSHWDQQALFTAHFVWKSTPEEGSEHHPQIHNATWRQG